MRRYLFAALAWALVLATVLIQPQRMAAQADTPTPTTVPVTPIQVATPRPDGSIIHVVQLGQFLATIAVAYQIPLAELLSLNGLNEQSVIFPGDALIIRLPFTATPASDQAISGTPSPEQNAQASSPTPRPATRTPTEAPPRDTPTPAALAATAAPTSQALEMSASNARQESKGPDFLLITVLILGVAGTALVALGSALKRSA